MSTLFRNRNKMQESFITYKQNCLTKNISSAQELQMRIKMFRIIGDTMLSNRKLWIVLVNIKFKKNKQKLNFFAIIASCIIANFSIYQH